MSNTPPRRTKSIGRIDRITSDIGTSNRYADRKRFIPTGGVRKPSSILARNIIARCKGSMPNSLPKGIINGATTIMAE